MKVQTILAVAATSAVLPFTAAWATIPTGPQGTGWYGSPNGAVPVPQTAPYVGYEGRSAAASGDTRTPDQRAETRPDERGFLGNMGARFTRGPLQGFSADTNPPAPPP